MYQLKVKQRDIKSYPANDIGKMDRESVEQLAKSGRLERIAYSTGINGCNGAIYNDKATNIKYKICNRSSYLWYFPW